MRRAAGREIVRDLNELGRYFIEFPDLNELYLRALEKPQELTFGERFRFERLITHAFSSFEVALEYHSDGLLDKEWWEKEGQFSFSQKFRDLVSERKAA